MFPGVGGEKRMWLQSGAHSVLVARREQLAIPSVVQLPEPAPAAGLILPDGTINWGCPCLGGMATGPCGAHFRKAFSCFHYSEADPKGSDCYEKFSEMQSCMARYPELYARDDDELPALPDAQTDTQLSTQPGQAGQPATPTAAPPASSRAGAT